MMTLHSLWRTTLLLMCGLQSAGATELRLLSAGAVEPGLRPALAAFEKASGHVVTLSFASAPQIRERVEGVRCSMW